MEDQTLSLLNTLTLIRWLWASYGFQSTTWLNWANLYLPDQLAFQIEHWLKTLNTIFRRFHLFTLVKLWTSYSKLSKANKTFKMSNLAVKSNRSSICQLKTWNCKNWFAGLCGKLSVRNQLMDGWSRLIQLCNFNKPLKTTIKSTPVRINLRCQP